MNSTPISRRGSKASTTHKPTVPQTRYMEMLLQQNKVPQRDNILASLFTWLSLASYVVFPGTFTSWRNSQAIKDVMNDSVIATAIYDSVQTIPFLVVATACCVVGTLGVVWLWLRWNNNFVWLVQMIFLLFNSLTGLINTLINVYTAQHGIWSITARATAGVTGSFTVITAGLFLWYNNWLLMKIRRDHDIELDKSNYAPVTL